MRNTEKYDFSSHHLNNDADSYGLFFEYCNRTRSLKIIEQPSQTILLIIPFLKVQNVSLPYVKNYIEALKKATEIHALVFSDNATTRITDLVDSEKLSAVLEYTSDIAFMAMHIKNETYKDLAQSTVGTFELKEMCIRKISSQYYTRGHFKARIQLLNDQSITIRACKCHTALNELSQRIIHDFVAHEYAHNNEARASQLMTLASRLAFVAKITDSKFLPEKQIM